MTHSVKHEVEHEEIYKALSEILAERIKKSELEERMKRATSLHADKINLDRNKYPRATMAEIYIITLYIVEPKLRNHIKENVPLDLFVTAFNKRVLNALYSDNSVIATLSEFTQKELAYIGDYFTMVHECARTRACVNAWIDVLKANKKMNEINLNNLSNDELQEYLKVQRVAKSV